MDILYQDNSILVCIKPAGVLSTDERAACPNWCGRRSVTRNACVRTVHRLDRVVSGLMVLARTRRPRRNSRRRSASTTSARRISPSCTGEPDALQGTYRDLPARPRRAQDPRHEQGWPRGVQEAVLDYDVLGTRAELLTRAHLSADRAHAPDPLPVFVAWSAALGDKNTARCPTTGRSRSGRIAFALLPTRTPARCSIFEQQPPDIAPWNLFAD